MDYYRGLISLRKQNREFRHSQPEDFKFLKVGKRVAVAYVLQDRFAVLMNGSATKALRIKLPKGRWQVLVDGESVDLAGKAEIRGRVRVPPTSGLVLRRIPS